VTSLYPDLEQGMHLTRVIQSAIFVLPRPDR